jgi:hypothetical protein
MMESNHRIQIQEVYKNYSPPIATVEIIDRLLNGIPGKYLTGLKSVVLRNAGGLNYDRRRSTTRSRKRKVPIVRCRGLYHEKCRSAPAWIEIFVDNLINSYPDLLLHIRFFRDAAFSEVLFHEIGHHIHKTQAPKYKECEDVAEDWRKKLACQYFRQQYWYLMPILLPLNLIIKLLRTITRRFKLTRRSS